MFSNVAHFVFLLILDHFIFLVTCNPEDLILRITISKDNSTFVHSTVVQERGAKFFLICNLMTSQNDSNSYNFDLSWVKPCGDITTLRFWTRHYSVDESAKGKLYPVLTGGKVTTAFKNFQALKSEDEGIYFCVSLKYNLVAAIEVIVLDNIFKPKVVKYNSKQQYDGIQFGSVILVITVLCVVSALLFCLIFGWRALIRAPRCNISHSVTSPRNIESFGLSDRSTPSNIDTCGQSFPQNFNLRQTPFPNGNEETVNILVHKETNPHNSK